MNIILEGSEKPAASRRRPTRSQKASDYTFEKQRVYQDMGLRCLSTKIQPSSL
ncbi:MAG: hypothetical protein LBC37_07695 [Zoogloeaceae bacterium]|jgi:hypothetical protein|nr:hypothetical protein [Zoogloeaceae bacterium]